MLATVNDLTVLTRSTVHCSIALIINTAIIIIIIIIIIIEIVHKAHTHTHTHTHTKEKQKYVVCRA